jgi:hypothetical protein
MLKTAVTIAAIFVAIVGAFTLTMDREQSGDVIVARSETSAQGDLHDGAQRPDGHPAEGPIVAGLQ